MGAHGDTVDARWTKLPPGNGPLTNAQLITFTNPQLKGLLDSARISYSHVKTGKDADGFSMKDRLCQIILRAGVNKYGDPSPAAASADTSADPDDGEHEDGDDSK